jgi:hypothetical protein
MMPDELLEVPLVCPLLLWRSYSGDSVSKVLDLAWFP